MKSLRKITRIFFPERCGICKETIPFNQPFCLCQGNEEIPLGKDVCHGCAREKQDCCCEVQNNITLQHLAAVYTYEGLTKVKLHSFKFKGNKALSKEFSLLMSERVATVFPNTDFDLVTFVPGDRASVKERGYNQSELLARGVGEKLFIPVEELLIKTEQTEKQHLLSQKNRIENLKGKFICREAFDLKGKTVLLCDDIKTTGATLHECCQAIITAGAKDVYCITVAVTPYFSSLSAPKSIDN